MKNHVERFAVQLSEALEISSKSKLTLFADIRQVVISGLGGSGIGGKVVADLVANECKVPIVVNNDYFMPHFVNEYTLVIISSYSGNTEETVNAMKDAIAKKAKIACITSGGQVAELAEKHGLDIINIPGGNPPRSCLGYSMVQLFTILKHNQLIAVDFVEQFTKAINLIKEKSQTIKAEATTLAKTLSDKMPVIYSLGNTEGIAIRLRQQINENSKMLCWHHVIPEMNHNELVGWTTKNENLAVVILRTSFDYEKNIKRLEVCKQVFTKYASSVTEIHAKGESTIEQTIYLIHLIDWLSCYIADIKQVDPVEIKIIDFLKAELAKA